jgi:hypothetical protein
MVYRIRVGVGRPRRSFVPLLMVLFVICWGLLTVLVVLQDRQIDAQRQLIHLYLAQTVPVRLHASPHSATLVNPSPKAASDVFVKPGSGAQLPLSQVPSKEAASQSPSSQVKPQANAKPGRSSRKARKSLPMRPPAELTDPSDMRRVSVSI